MPYNSWFNDYCLSFRLDSDLLVSGDFARFPAPSQLPEQGQQGWVFSTYPSLSDSEESFPLIS